MRRWLSYIIVVLFLYTAYGKAWDMFDLKIEASTYSYLPQAIRQNAPLAAVTAELIIAIMLTTDRLRSWGLGLAAVVLFVFTLHIIWLDINHINSCACAGKDSWLSMLPTRAHVVLNVMLSTLALLFTTKPKPRGVSDEVKTESPGVHTC